MTQSFSRIIVFTVTALMTALSACTAQQAAIGEQSIEIPNEDVQADGAFLQTEARNTASINSLRMNNRACGQNAPFDCDENEYCDFGTSTDACGLQGGSGVCKVKPVLCPLNFVQVCGCDGLMYANPCAAHQSGVTVAPSIFCPGV